MAFDELSIRRAVVLGAALIYWGGVWVQARRVRKSIGRSPNLKPRGFKERVLWVGWFLVVTGWILLPWLARPEARSPGMRIAPALLGRGGLATGVVLIAAGYAGTLWCYWAMGDRWRMGIDRKQKGPLVTRGPYRVVRHPIYLFQIVMLVGVVILLPVWLAMAVLSLHGVCVVIKALDEETHLLEAYGAVYRNYAAQTGMLLPRLPKRVPKMKNRPD